MEQGDCLNGPTERMVELAERLVGLVTHADWALFSKNGTDATTTCVTLARGATGKRKVLLANGAYHGAGSLVLAVSLRRDVGGSRAHPLFRLQRCREPGNRGRSSRQRSGAIVVSAFRHDYGKHQELPDPRFAARARALCDANDAALILDDVRAGFRLTLHGSWDQIGVQPDLSAWSKAIANGYALSAVMGNDRFRDAAAQLYATGSFWCGATSMAAALATIDVLQAETARSICGRWASGCATASPSRRGAITSVSGKAARRRCQRFCSRTMPTTPAAHASCRRH
jgi:glutamate-1-semialdehyde 2,1-aminomutase